MPTPHLGDRVEYIGSDGAILTVTVRGAGERADPWLNRVPVLILDYSYKAPTWPGTYQFEEAVDHSGRIVQQLAVCAVPYHPDNNKGPCMDDRVDVYFGGWGLPGALGVGPLWFTDSVPSRLELPLRTGAPSVLDVKATGADDDCLALRYQGPPLGYNMMPFTVGNGTLTVCPADPFPRTFASSVPWSPAFSTTGTVTFTARSATTGGEPIERPGETTLVPSSALAFQEIGSPAYTNPPDTRPFTTQDAVDHAAALEPGVSGFLAAHPTAIAAVSVYRIPRSGTPGVLAGGYVTESRVVYLADGSGPCLRIEIERENRTAGSVPLDEDRMTYTLVGSGSCTHARFEMTAIAPSQAVFESAVSWGETITGLSFQAGYASGYSHRARGLVWADDRGFWLQTGYELAIGLTDPNPRNEGGVASAYIYDFLVDGASGSINKVSLPKEKSPL